MILIKLNNQINLIIDDAAPTLFLYNFLMTCEIFYIVKIDR